MFFLDNLFLSPLLWIVKEINQAAQQAIDGEAEAVTRSLSALYTKLETGAITEEEFEIEEKQLLDRLDIIDLRNQDPNAKSDAGTDDGFDEDEDEADDRGRLTPPDTD